MFKSVFIMELFKKLPIALILGIIEIIFFISTFIWIAYKEYWFCEKALACQDLSFVGDPILILICSFIIYGLHVYLLWKLDKVNPMDPNQENEKEWFLNYFSYTSIGHILFTLWLLIHYTLRKRFDFTIAVSILLVFMTGTRVTVKRVIQSYY